MSAGVAQFKVYLNNSSHDARVIMDDAEVQGRPVGIPVKPQSAQDLYATAIGDEGRIPWTPDDAWSDGVKTVIVWYRPMPTLPAMMLGPDGEQRAAPLVVTADGTIALVYPDRVTRFQLRMDDRTLAFSDIAPKRSTRRAKG